MSEDLNPIVPETEAPVEAQPENQKEQSVEAVNYSNKGLKELVESLAHSLENDPMQELYKRAEAIKAAFYKTLRKEKVEAGGEVSAEPEQAQAPEQENEQNNPKGGDIVLDLFGGSGTTIIAAEQTRNISNLQNIVYLNPKV